MYIDIFTDAEAKMIAEVFRVVDHLKRPVDSSNEKLNLGPIDLWSFQFEDSWQHWGPSSNFNLNRVKKVLGIEELPSSVLSIFLANALVPSRRLTTATETYFDSQHFTETRRTGVYGVCEWR